MGYIAFLEKAEAVGHTVSTLFCGNKLMTIWIILEPFRWNTLYWVGQKVHVVFFPTNDTFIIFTNNFIYLDILCMSALSHMAEHWLFSMSQFDCYQLQRVYPTVGHRPARNLQHKTLPTTFNTFNQSQHLLHTLIIFAFQLWFYLSWNNKA